MMSVNGRPTLPSRAALKRAIAVTVLAGVGAGLPLIAATGANAAPLHQGTTHQGGSAHHFAAPQSHATQQAPAATPAPAAAPAAPASYTVQSGDWLSKIATDHNVQGGWQKLYDLNKSVLVQGPNVIHPGQHLALGAAQAQAPAPAAAPAPAKPELQGMAWQPATINGEQGVLFTM
ncbi:LysM peptidoglycan-binding domain-containing protein, partial [Kitasatospora sp. LaBMicrA B282]|uniref:LysM peptidoglycan-binding domain-containing protein n=1 Tax=Kitasatospora sp. LaBMicrA B282 TaxID=3420949 RepID=UPI003D1515A1